MREEIRLTNGKEHVRKAGVPSTSDAIQRLLDARDDIVMLT